VFQEMAKVFVGQNAVKPPTALETSSKLEVGQVGLSIAADQPVLLLGEIVVTNAGATKPTLR
jgi:hypothetical protein